MEFHDKPQDPVGEQEIDAQIQVDKDVFTCWWPYEHAHIQSFNGIWAKKNFVWDLINNKKWLIYYRQTAT